MTYYQTFEPWKIQDGQVVVADEKLSEFVPLCPNCNWNEQQCECPTWKRPVVKIATDIFEDVEGPVVDCSLKPLHESWDSRVAWTTINRINGKPIRGIGINDILTRFFQTIDSTPHVDYLIPTLFPERVRGLWQNNMPDNVGTPEDADAMWLRHRSNVILAVPVETQADIERLVPELLNCHDLCKGLAVIARPKEELDLSQWMREFELQTCQSCGEHCEGELNHAGKTSCCHSDSDSQGSHFECDIDLIIIEGNEHPEHIQSLKEQCELADVELKEDADKCNK